MMRSWIRPRGTSLGTFTDSSLSSISSAEYAARLFGRGPPTPQKLESIFRHFLQL